MLRRNGVDLVEIEKFTPRVFESQNSSTSRRIEYLTRVDYEAVGHQEPILNLDDPIFTIILTLFDGKPEFIRFSLEAAFSQSYENTEVVLIDNGSTGEVLTLINEAFLTHGNAKLLRFSEHRFDPTVGDFLDPIPNLWNAGLFASVGDFVYVLSYDDALSTDYVARMVRLFEENENCMSAAPMVCSINEENEINMEFSEFLRATNVRGRYTDGITLAKSKMQGSNLIGAPGDLLAQRSELVISEGGFDSLNDYGQIFRFAILGDSGFDPEATLFWRHHEMQANKIQKGMGLVYYSEYVSFPERYGIQALNLEVGGSDYSKEFDIYWKKLTTDQALSSLKDSFADYGTESGKAALKRLLQESPLTVSIQGLFCLALFFPSSFIRRRFPRVVDWAKRIKKSLKY